MYLNNPQKLFKDLRDIETLSSYMDATEEDGQENDLENLISIVEYQIDCALSGDSLRWSTNDNITLSDILNNSDDVILDSGAAEILMRDFQKLKGIQQTIHREQRAKYIITCQDCGETYYYINKPKYSIENYKCHVCKGNLKIKEEQ